MHPVPDRVNLAGPRHSTSPWKQHHNAQVSLAPAGPSDAPGDSGESPEREDDGVGAVREAHFGLRPVGGAVGHLDGDDAQLAASPGGRRDALQNAVLGAEARRTGRVFVRATRQLVFWHNGQRSRQEGLTRLSNTSAKFDQSRASPDPDKHRKFGGVLKNSLYVCVCVMAGGVSTYVRRRVLD